MRRYAVPAAVSLVLAVSFAAVPSAARAGDAAAPAVAPVVLFGVTMPEQFGMKIAPLPDVGADGVPELVTGLQNLSPLFGEANVRSGVDGTSVHAIVPAFSEQVYPTDVGDAGDVDRDGVHDVVVGSEGGDHDQRRGAVRVFSGASGALLWSATGAVGEQLGTSVAGVGDVDGDGAADVVAGAREFAGVGRVQLYAGATGTLLRTFTAPSGARDFGATVARLRDANGDRRDDLLVGAPAIDLQNARTVHVLSLADGAPISVATGPAQSQAFGARAGSAGDFDGDGRGDYWVGDSSLGGTLQRGGPGRFEVYSGATAALLYRLDGAAFDDQLGRGGASADFDGDGRSDVVLGAFDGPNGSVGRIEVRAGPDGRLLRTLNGTVANERLGNDTEVLGDANGNGTLDLLATTFGAAAPRIYALDAGIGPGGALVAPVAAHTGLWYEPSHDGEGFILEMLDGGRAVAYFFTYTRTGAQRYFVGVGQVVGRRIVFPDLLTTSGGRLGGAFDPADVQRVDQSRLVLSFDGCDSGWADYTIDGSAHRQRLARLTGVPGLACAGGSVVRRDWSGSWYDAAHSGEGWIVQSVDATRYVVVWFSYRADGTQQWFIGVMPTAGARLEDPAIVQPLGGRFGPYFDRGEVTRGTWGRLTLDFDGCDRAQVSWNGTDGAGTSPLVRLTALQSLRCE